MFHVDSSINRIGIDTGATDLSAGNYAVLNVGGVVSNAGSQQYFVLETKQVMHPLVINFNKVV